MHQLVFVHGVNTRKGTDYDLEVANRNKLFLEVAWKGVPLNIRNTYWGGWAAEFSHDLACLPSRGPKAASFGLLGGMTAAPVSQAQPLTAVGRTAISVVASIPSRRAKSSL
jgi:hypothetical protein